METAPEDTMKTGAQRQVEVGPHETLPGAVPGRKGKPATRSVAVPCPGRHLEASGRGVNKSFRPRGMFDGLIKFH